MNGEGGYGAPILGPVYLPPRQKRIVDEVLRGAASVDEVAERLHVKREDLMRDIEELRARGLIRVEKRSHAYYELTGEAQKYLESGLPEARVLMVLEKAGRPVKREELSSEAERLGVRLSPKEASIGVSQLARTGALKFTPEGIVLGSPEKAREAVSKTAEALRRLKSGEPVDEKVLSELRRRKLVTRRERAELLLSPTDTLRFLEERGMIKVGRVITTLTPEDIESGAWREAYFKPFDLSVEPPTPSYGRKHPYLEFLDWIREILVSMGFEEMKGPHVELELWNFDALFQAQDHPAREIHDTYFVKGRPRGRFGDAEYMERVARTHRDGWLTGSRGWGYEWDPERALRLVLRTQTTAVSMRTIYSRGPGEYMCFSLDRVFRPENLDAKHSMEFYQLEGIIVGRHVTFRHLLGFFREMARRLGLGEVKVKPAYFPFTEPSVEGFIKHPHLGWIEVFPGGMFRPEVIEPLGLKGFNVAAWGIGVDRIAMTVMGIDDIRLLFTQDVEWIRSQPRPLIREMLR